MKYTRQEHSNFLEEELQAQTKAFNQKLNTSATFLLQEREELFVAQFLTFKDGEMILKFSTKRGLPRKGEYLYCFTVPKELRDYRNWGEKTYGDLVKEKSNFTETVCVWQAPSKDKDGNLEKDFYIAGFRGVELDFSVNISDAEKIVKNQRLLRNQIQFLMLLRFFFLIVRSLFLIHLIYFAIIRQN